MMISLSERQEQISKFLQNSKMPIGIEEISKKFNISKRSVYYDLEMIERWTSFSDFQLLRDSKAGVLIKATEDGKENFTYSTFFSQENRKKVLLFSLFFNEGFLTAQDISEVLTVSRNTIINDIKSIRQNLKSQNIHIEGVRSHGYQIYGNEETIREYFTKLIISNASTYDLVSWIMKDKEDKNLGTVLALINSKVQLSQIKKAIKNTSEDYKFWLPDIDYIKFVIYQSLSIERIKINHQINESFPFSEKIKTSEEYQIAKLFCSNITNLLGLDIKDSEITKTAQMLLTCNIKTNNKKNKKDQFYHLLNKAVDEMVKSISLITTFKNESYKKLHQDILNHLKLTIKQIQYGIVGENPLLGKIKLHYSQSYKIAEKMASIFSDYMDIQLPESEIGYLALHIAVYLEAAIINTENPKAIVICNSGKGSANILSMRLKTCIPELQIMGDYSILDIEENEAILEDVDLIISTINYTNSIKPVLIISPLLSENEIILIKNFINHNNNSIKGQSPGKKIQILGTLKDRLNEKFETTITESIINELKEVLSLYDEHYIHNDESPHENSNGGDITALIVLQVMTMINELEAINVLLSKEETIGLLIHVIMSIDRWKRGDFFKEPDLESFRKNYSQEFMIVSQLLEESQSILHRTIPDSEAVSILRYLVKGGLNV